MTSAVFDYLTNWIQETLGPVDISSAPPADDTNGRTVSLYLREIEASPASGTTRVSRRLQLQLTYLVTTAGDDPHGANNDLATLAFAAMTDPRIEPDLTPLSTEEWLAFRVTPRPSFTVRIPLNADITTHEAKRVEKPMIIKGSARLPDKPAGGAHK